MHKIIDRPPRIQPPLPIEEIEVPAPPDQAQDQQSIFEMLMPMAMVVGFIAIAFMGRGGAMMMFFLVPMVIGLGGTIFFGIRRAILAREAAKQAKISYKAQLETMRNGLRGYHQQQRDYFFYNYPNLNMLRGITTEENYSRIGPRIWERRPEDSDFGILRLGLGTRRSTVIYKMSSSGNQGADPLFDEAQRLVQDSLFVSNIPITLALRPTPPLAKTQTDNETLLAHIPRNSLGIYYAGVSLGTGQTTTLSPQKDMKDTVYKYSYALLSQFASFHSSIDAQIYIVASQNAKHEEVWEWARQLPHCQVGENESRICYEDENVKTYNDEQIARLPEFWKDLRKVLQVRQQRMREQDAGDVRFPFILVVVDILELSTKQKSRLIDVESEATVSMIMKNGLELGAAIIFLAPFANKVPSDCQALVELEGASTFRYAETEVNSTRYVGQADLLEKVDADAVAYYLKDKSIRFGAAATLPLSFDFLQLNEAPDIEGLKYPENWKRSREQVVSWPRVRIGRAVGNEPHELVFSANKSGIHGMIAGTTGSGKSELLLTIIMGLAINYDPSLVNFLLVDYKGGAAFDKFRHLPHCIDIITNLDDTAVERVFASISAELDRRQKIIAESDVDHIVQYREKDKHKDKPLPHLFIIIDEFAEMIADRPEYRAQLDSITRVGRAIGVHLILAAQKPAGVVTDQMRANMKFKICLRVENPEDSRELLRNTDAAYLPAGIPGRGYTQVGNEIPEIIQVAYASAPYRASKKVNTSRKAIIWDDEDSLLDNEPVTAEEKSQVEVIIKQMDEYARANRSEVREQRKAWPDQLPLYLPLEQEISTEYLSETDINFLIKLSPEETISPELPLNSSTLAWLLEKADADWKTNIWNNNDLILKAPIGLIDHPTQARQLIAIVDLMRQGHVVIFGASGWGKTTALRTLIVSLASTHSPRDLHIYIMDFGGNGMDNLRQLPHVGTVITAAEDDRIKQMVLILLNMMDERKMALQGQDLISHNRRGTVGELFPAVLVVIDNFVEISENYENLMVDLISIMREGRSLGIYFAISAALPNQLGGKVFNLITNRISLTLSDSSEYSSTMGRSGPPFREAWGRGLIGLERETSRNALEFQIAATVGLPADDVDELKKNNKDRTQLQIEQILLDKLVTTDWNLRFKFLVRAMQKARERNAYDSKSLPRDMKIADKVTMLGLKKNIHDIEELAKQIPKNWAQSLDDKNAHWPIVEFGMRAGDETVSLEFSSDSSGVHGIIAGTTGSGKSELLLSIIIGLAVNYPPAVVNFLLVDFKGGAAFDELRDLPHCIDVVTNLDKPAVERFFASIKAELDRRTKIISDSGNKHLVEYRQEGKHHQQAFPHLFIIIDEFAEMIADNPEFKPQLDSITRLGRAIGVHLILAAQKPAGLITEQMRANMNFRICLRVKDPEDSRELLRYTDAAFIPVDRAGRAYFQVGNQTPEMIQTAFSGVKFPVKEKNIFKPISRRMDNNPTLAKIIIEYSKYLTEQKGHEFPAIRKSWPDPLPRYLPLDHSPLDVEYLDKKELEWLSNYQQSPINFALNRYVQDWMASRGRWDREIWSKPYILKTPIGIADQPSQGKQRLITVDLMKGPIAIFGASGRGKKTFLRSLMIGLTANHSPQDLHIYILDFTGHAFDNFDQSANDGAKLPHLGSIINGDETEKVNRVIRTLTNMLEERKAIIPTRGEDIVKYNLNRRAADQHFPAVLVIINNFDEIRENHENLHQPLTSLIREGRSAGIFFAISAARYSSLGSKLFSLVATRATLYQTDPNEYVDLVGRGGPVFREIMGRGLVSVERDISHTPLEIQIAAPLGLPQETYQSLEETQKGLAFDGVLADQLPNHLPKRLLEYIGYQEAAAKELRRDLPKTIDNLTSYVTYQELHQIPSEGYSVILGIEDNDLSEKDLILDDAPHFLIVGPPLSGKTNFLQTWIIALSELYPPEKLAMVLIDPRRRLFTDGRTYNLGELPHVLMTISEEDQLARFVQKLKHEFKNPSGEDSPGRALFVFVDNYDDFPILDEHEDMRKTLAKLARSYERSGLHFILTKADSDSLGNDALIKQVWQLYRYGFALQNEQSLERLGGRLPRSARQMEMPVGRGYITRSGQLQLMQVASLIPVDRQEDRAKQINLHVQRLLGKWIKQKPIVYNLSSFPRDGIYETTELTSSLMILDYHSGEITSQTPQIRINIKQEGEEFVLRLANASEQTQGFIGILMVHDEAVQIPNLTKEANARDELRLIALTDHALGLNLKEYEDEKLTQLKLLLSLLEPNEVYEVRFSAQEGAFITMSITEDQSNHWQDDYYPSEDEEEQRAARTAHFDSSADEESYLATLEESDRKIKIAPEVAESLLPVRGEKPPESLNLDNQYHRLLSATTLQALPEDIIWQIPFEGAEQIEDLPALFRQTPSDELQAWIDADEFYLPKTLDGNLLQSIRRFKQEQGIA